jgi:hypothetical protein
MVFLY